MTGGGKTSSPATRSTSPRRAAHASNFFGPQRRHENNARGRLSSSKSDVGNACRPLYGALPIHDGLFTASLYDIYSGLNPDYSSTTRGVSLKVDHKWNGLAFGSISAARDTGFGAAIIVDGGPGTPLDLHLSVLEHQISREFSLSGQQDFGLKWQVGSYLYFDGGKETENIFGSILGPIADEKLVGSQDTQSYAAYAQGTQTLGFNTRLTPGLRYTYEEREQTAHELLYRTSGVVTPLISVDRGASFDAPSWHIALDHDFNHDVLGYVTFNMGFKSGGYNPLGLTTPAVQPETIDAFETGVRNHWFGRRLRLNAPSFTMIGRVFSFKPYQWHHQSDECRQREALRSGSRPGSASEVEFALSAGLENMLGSFGDFPNATGAVSLPAGGSRIAVINATGYQIPYDPHLSGNVALDYTIPTDVGSFSLNVTARYSAGYYPEVNNFLYQEAFTVVNSTINWTTQDGKYVFAIRGRTLGNQF